MDEIIVEVCGNYQKGKCALTGDQCPYDEQEDCRDYE
jgi:hypothetical protein